MRQRLDFTAVEQNDVAGSGLLLAQLQAQADPFDVGCVLPALQRVPNALAICGQVQPESVSSTARARCASPRSRDPTRTVKAAG